MLNKDDATRTWPAAPRLQCNRELVGVERGDVVAASYFYQDISCWITRHS